MTDNSTTLLTLGTADTQLALALIFCFMFLVIGLKHPVFLMFAGFVWILSALAIFIDYAVNGYPMFELIGIGVGIVCLLEGALKIAD